MSRMFLEPATQRRMVGLFLLLAVVLNGRCAALNGFQQGLTINPPGGSS